MRKILFVIGIALISCTSMVAQQFNIGAGAALPVGDANDVSSFGINVEANYLWEVSEQFGAGLTVGYLNYFGKTISNPIFDDVSFDDFGFLPIAASGRFQASEKFTLGLDLGFALGLSPDGIDDGFYWAPKAQYGITQSLDLVLAFRSINLDGGSFDALSLGIEFGL